jgi:putative aldouronate transport system substrate-binding protein
MVIILVMLASCAPAATPPPAPTQPPTPTEAAKPTEAQAVQPTAAPTEKPAEPTQAPAKVYKVTWYQGCPWISDALPANPTDDFEHEYILKNYGIDLKITFNAECDDSKTSAMIAAGDLPDFMQQYWSTGNSILSQLIDQGIVLPIDLSKYPGMKNAIPAEAFKFLTRNDQIWGFAPPNDPTHLTLWVRQDWLDKLGLKAPTTPEETLEVLKAFTTKDPDGNKKNDTYGLTGYLANGNPFNGLTSLMAPYGFAPGLTDLMIKDNKAYYPGLSEGAKQGLMWLNTAVKAKVIDPGWSTNTEDLFRQTVGNDKVGLVTYYHYMLNPNFYDVANMITAKGTNANWQYMDPLTGPAGKIDQVVALANGTGNAFFVTKQAQSEPGKYEALMKFLDDAINTKSDLYRFMVFGIKDKTYWTDDQGNITKYSRKPDYLWQGNYRLFRTGNTEYRVGSWGVTQPTMVTGFARQDKLPVLFSVRGLVPAAEGQADLDQYVLEMHTKFVTGEESFDNWDKFVNEATTKYKGQVLLDDATARLKALGLIQ